MYTLSSLATDRLRLGDSLPAFLVMTSHDYYGNTTLLDYCQPLLGKGVLLYLFQAINLLDFLEWRLERGLPIDEMRVVLSQVAGELFSLSRVYFGDLPYPFVRLVGPSVRLGLTKLALSGWVSMEVEEVALGKVAMGLVAFLRMLWRE